MTAARPTPTKRRATAAAAIVALAALAVALACLRDFGPTWDAAKCEVPYGERLLAWWLAPRGDCLEAMQAPRELEQRQPHPEFGPDLYVWFWNYPFAGLLSAASCRILWTELGWMPAMEAHHLPVALLFAACLFVVARFVAARLGPAAGIAAAAFLALSPRVACDSLSNVKDAPEACLYTLAAFAGYAALKGGRVREWLAAGALAGCALAQKPNALFLPVQALLFVLVANAARRRRGDPPLRASWRGLLAGGLAFAAVYALASPIFWVDTVARLTTHFEFMLGVGNSLRASDGRIEGASVSFGALRDALLTTPPTILLFAAIGAASSRLSTDARAFLVVGALLPVARTLLPGMVNYDGTRHFLEYAPPLCALAACGLRTAADAARARAGRLAPAAATLVWALALVPCAVATVATYPYGSCYFNAFAGGLDGARRRQVPDATDYWGLSYWEGLDWLRREAERGAAVLVPVAGHVAEAAAPVRARADLSVNRVAEGESPPAVYVMFIRRPNFYGPLPRMVEAARAPAKEVLVQGAPILAIHRFAGGREEIDAVVRAWKAERDASPAHALALHVARDPAARAALDAAISAPLGPKRDAAARRAADGLPPELRGGVAAALELADAFTELGRRL